MAEIVNYFTCNCCLFAQDLDAEFLDGVSLGIPDESREAYIDCHYDLHRPLTEKTPEYNLKHRQSTGCGKWLCGICGHPHEKFSHTACWNK